MVTHRIKGEGGREKEEGPTLSVSSSFPLSFHSCIFSTSFKATEKSQLERITEGEEEKEKARGRLVTCLKVSKRKKGRNRDGG